MPPLTVPRWRFRAMAPSEVNQNPFQGEFFSSSLPERFVRESIQNSLDAASGDRPVTVRFTISGPEGALDGVRAVRYLADLAPHVVSVLDAEAKGVADESRRRELDRRQALFDEPLSFLVVEDFGTTGLRGDVRANGIEEKNNDFWGFFRSIGISPKPEDAGGSWGLGKWVFPDASMVNAFIGVTRRADESRTLIMGQAMLKMHRLNGRRYPPVGFFAEESDDDDKEWLPMPVESARNSWNGCFVRDAVDDFGLQRGRRPGTSVIVPHPHPELTDPDKLVRAVIEQYFHPVVTGRLVVEVASPETTVRIDTDTIADKARLVAVGASADEISGEQASAALVAAIALDRWGLDLRDEEVEVDGRRTKAALGEALVPAIRARYEAGERLAFRVLPGGRWDRQRNAFRVLLERDESLATGHDYFVRGYLHIPRMDYLAKHRARALVLVDSGTELGHLLRDSEGPAHERWRGTADRLRRRGWKNPTERVWEVQNAARRILDALVEKPTQIDRHMLADLFPSRLRGPRVPKPDPPRVSRNPLKVTQRPQGFRIVAKRGHDLSGSEISVRMAYDVARGGAHSAFKAFQRGADRRCPDFSLQGGALAVQASECEPRSIADNELRVQIASSGFILDVTGFDSRDVVVDVRLVRADDGTGSAE